MPAILPGVLNQSFYEDIRDRIAQILVLEIPAQGVLLTDPVIAGIDKVYTERSIAFSEEVLPAVNVVFEKVDFGNETSVGVNFTAEYSVQVYGSAKSDVAQRADEKSSKFVQKLGALVQGILSYGGYNRLGFSAPSATNGISNRKVYGIQFFNPESSGNSEMIVRAMVRVRVEGFQSKLEVEPRALLGSDTEMVLFDSNEAYFYTTDNPILPPPSLSPCEPVIVSNSDGSWTVTQLSGVDLTVPDSSIEVNGNDEGLIIAVKDVQVNVFDSVGPSSIVGVDVVDNEVNIEVDNSCAAASYTVEYENGTPIQSGTIPSGGSVTVEVPNPTTCSGTAAITSTGQVGDPNGSYYTLPTGKLNKWGHNWRLCGITGGYTDGVGYFDVNGVATTRALAFPEGLMCDLGHVDCDGNFPMVGMNGVSATGYVIYSVADAYNVAYSTASFPTGFRTPTINELDNWIDFSVSSTYSQKPFEKSGAQWWSQTDAPSSAKFIVINTIWRTSSPLASAAGMSFPVRITNISEI